MNLGLEIEIYVLENTCLKLEMGPRVFALRGNSFCTKCLCLGYIIVKSAKDWMHNKHCSDAQIYHSSKPNPPDAPMTPLSEKSSVSIDIF